MAEVDEVDAVRRAWLQHNLDVVCIQETHEAAVDSREQPADSDTDRSARTHGEGVSVVGGYQWMMVGHQLVDGFPFPVSGALPPVREFTGSR